MSENTINIALAADDNYAVCMGITILSVLKSASKEDKLVFHILENQISAKRKAEIESLKKFREFDIFWIPLNPSDFKQCKVTQRGLTLTTYARFLISDTIPCSKVLYLDCDITIVNDIANLYNHNLKNNLVGAIVDNVVTSNDIFINYAENALGVSGQKYFNSGVLVMNLEEFRKNDIENKFLYLLNNYNFGTVAPDQDYLNVLCKDKVLYIDKGWDRMPIPDENFDDKNLRLIHYNMYQKPWRYSNVLYENYFWDVAKTTKYYQFFIDTRNAYTEEMKANDSLASAKLLAYAKNIASDPTNFKNTVERESHLIAIKNHLQETESAEINVLDNFLNIIFNEEPEKQGA